LAGLRGQSDPAPDMDEPEEPDEIWDGDEERAEPFEPGSEFELGSNGPITQRSGDIGWAPTPVDAAAQASAPVGPPAQGGPEVVLAVQPDFSVEQADEATPAVGGSGPEPQQSPQAAEPLSIRTELAADLRAHDELRPGEPTGTLRPPGSFGRAEAERQLGEAQDVHGTLEIFVRFAQQLFERVLLLVVQGGRAEARLGNNVPADMSSLRVALDRPSLFKHAHDTAQVVIERLGPEGIDGAVKSSLGLGEEVEVVAIPILVRQRVVAVLYADDVRSSVDRDAVAEAAGFANVVGNAIAALIVRRKRDKT